MGRHVLEIGEDDVCCGGGYVNHFCNVVWFKQEEAGESIFEVEFVNVDVVEEDNDVKVDDDDEEEDDDDEEEDE